MFDLGEGLFDGVEVGRVGPQAPEPGAGRLHHLSDRGRLVGALFVRDDDVAGFERSDELLFNTGAEARYYVAPATRARL
jgi:hypothetical protein